MTSFADPESFRPFVEENFAGVASFAWSVLGSGLEAEDVAQDAFVLVYRRRHRIDPNRSARAYLFRAAFRLCLSRLRRQKRRAALALLAAPLARSVIPPPADPLDAWFRSLSKRQRAIAHLHFGQDRDAGEIASALGIRPATVRVQLARIRARIQAMGRSIPAPRRCSDASG
jgi:RNA polymerase sigma-70 factor (ECF subfamily)